MPRTDDNGRSLESLLTYLLDGVSAQDISEALDVSTATYHRRKHAPDYPNAEELRLIAAHFALNPVDLMIRFGLVSPDDIALAGGIPGPATATEPGRQIITPRVDDQEISTSSPLVQATRGRVAAKRRARRKPRYDETAPGL
jgi:hypothetical protein